MQEKPKRVEAGAISAIWDDVYASKSEQERSWSQETPAEALQYIEAMELARDTPMIDIGGGSSHLIDELLSRDFTDLTVLDISSKSLEEARTRTNASVYPIGAVTWVVADILKWGSERPFGLWHDRALFHFLITEQDQRAYVELATKSIAPSGHLLIGTFAPDGPEMCSGLPVTRWSAEGLTALFSRGFSTIDSKQVLHKTPSGRSQPFTWVHLVRNPLRDA